MRSASAFFGAFLLCLAPSGFPALAQEPPATVEVCPSRSIYCASGSPDRVVLTPGVDPARQMAVAWRTDSRQEVAGAEIRKALDGPELEEDEVELEGETFPLETENGLAHFHQVRFDELEPDTPYVYRLRGADDWSEWFQFRTAAAEFRPFRFIYFGDQQNDILELGSRVVRQAFRSTANPALVVHAGDLVQQRDGDVHDDEWGEWFESGAYNYAIAPQIVAAGNHEYVTTGPDLGEGPFHVLGPHWTRQFAFPGNGAPGVESTTQVIDYQNVRFVVLDNTSALDLDTLDVQTQWLDRVLAEGDPQWRIVLMHQPLFTCARENDPSRIQRAWRSLFEEHGVDLVLQGHDHCYSRLTDPEGGRAGFEDGGVQQGPVYLVSVAGGKMYALNDRATIQPDRVAEDTQLYQVIGLEEDRLAFSAYTASGALYDAFQLIRSPDGVTRINANEDLLAERMCREEVGPDDFPCTARRR